MPTTDDPEVFKERWNGHIDQLKSLKLTLPTDDWDDLEEAQEELRELVDAAVENLEEDE